MKVSPGGTADQTIHATDPDGDGLLFTKGSGPDFMSVTTIDSGSGTASGNVHLAPPEGTVIGVISVSVAVSDGANTDELSFSIVSGDNIPSIVQPLDMTLRPFQSADQTLQATDADQDPLTFALAAGPWFASVTTTGPGSGNVHLAPALADSGSHLVSVSASDGIAWDVSTFTASVLPGTVPTMSPIVDMTALPGQVARQNLTGRDVDGDELWLRKSFGPSFMNVVSRSWMGNVGGYIEVTPSLTDSPTQEGGDFDFPAGVSLSDGRNSVEQSFTIHIRFPANHAPILEQPADIHVQEGGEAHTPLVFSDPDADPLNLSITGPEWAFVPYGGINTLIVWPGWNDAGTYPVTVRVSDPRGLYDEKTLHIIVADAPSPPILSTPKNMLVFAGRTAVQDLRAVDHDGLPVTFIKSAGPGYATVETIDPGTGSARGRLTVAPAIADVGRDTVEILAWNGAWSQWWPLAVEVADPGRTALMQIGDLCLYPSDSLVVEILADDPEGDHLTFATSGLPPYGTFTDHENGTATMALWTQNQPKGATFMTVSVTDGQATVSEMLGITVGCGGAVFPEEPGNGWPTPNPGGPYAAFEGTPISFDGTQSSDPEGQPLQYAWNFGDGAVATGPTPVHTFENAGTFRVDLSVSDGLAAADRVSTIVTITPPLNARAWVPEGRGKVRLNAGKAPLQIWLEPSGFPAGDVDLGTLALVYGQAGGGESIQGSAVAGDAVDRDGNGRPEIAVSFDKQDLRSLLASITGPAQVTATVTGRTLGGSPFRAALPLTLLAGHGKISAVVYPNPLNPSATLSFTTLEPGPAIVAVFDLQGRLVRKLMEQQSAPAGYHEVRIDGRNAEGEKLASGVYFYRIETVGDVTTGRFAVMK
jgi:hypothetical protein